MNDTKARVAVIGVGMMGRNHARIYRELAGASLVGVCDMNPEVAAQVAGIYGTRAYGSHEELLAAEHPDGVSVCVPTEKHKAVTLAALASGCHVLVEKPIAASMTDANELLAAARSAGRVLAVGHVERFNPAVIALHKELNAGRLGRVFQFHARRLGPFPTRVRDVGVVIDLATHDLDMMTFLGGSAPSRVFAETRSNVLTQHEDLMNAIIRFDNDVLGLLEVSWLTPTKIRELYVTGEHGMFRADYLTQDLYFYENADASLDQWSALSVLRGVSEGPMTRLAVRKVEPLRAELEGFVGAIQTGGNIVTGEDARATLSLALALIQSARTHMVVVCDSR